MTEKESKEIKDLATEAAVLSLIPEDVMPCKENDKTCTGRGSGFCFADTV